MKGGHVSLAYFLEKAVFKGEISYLAGTLNYTSATTGVADRSEFDTWEPRLIVGYYPPLTDQYSITSRILLYSGVAFRWTNGSVSSPVMRWYDRSSTYVYMPIGISLNRNFNSRWYMGATAEIDIFLWGWHDHDFSEGGKNKNWDNTRTNISSGYGYRVSLEFLKDFVEFAVGIEPFIRYWHIDKSETSGVYYNYQRVGEIAVPENTTIETGANIVWKFWF